jgi:predicted metal-dependent hydrolase
MVTLERGVELFNQGRYWEAHEAWEQAWVPDRYGPDRGLYKGLIQVAAGCLHHRRRNRRGTLNQWRSGIDYLRPYLPRHHGLELQPLVERIEVCLTKLETGTWPVEAELPHIEMVPNVTH